MTARLDAAFRRSIDDPDGFWGEAARDVRWETPWDRVLDAANAPFYRWFPGATLNTCFNAVDRHVEEGRGAQPAIIHDSPVTDSKRTITYAALKTQTARFAGMLRDLGVATGDRVVIYMPMVPEALVAMLGCARLGAIHSVVFGGFAPRELATRINDAKPKAIVTASCGIEPTRVVPYKPMVDEAIEVASHKVESVVVLQRDRQPCDLIAGRDVDWNEAMAAAAPADCVTVAATDPLYILYTSGTTGQPKGVVRDNGGHLVALKWSMRHIYGVEPGEVFWAASDIGWVVGHSYIVYAPLFHGCTTVLFEGKPVGTPDAGAFWRVIAEHGVNVMVTAPTALRVIKREDPDGELLRRHDLSRFRTQFLAGERTDPDSLEWAERMLKVPVIDHWWQTETGWAIAADCMGIEPMPVKPGSASRPVPGYDVRILHGETHEEQPRGQMGAICIRLPLPPGSLPTLWNADERYRQSYLEEFPGHYMTGDAGYMDEDGYVFVMSRTDDIINVAGHRLTTGAMEEVLAHHPDVAECAVIGVRDEIKGQMPLGFLVLKAGVERPHETIVGEVVRMVREAIGPVAAFRTAAVVDRLPKTRSGKVLRGTMQKIAEAEAYRMPATIEDPAALDEIEAALKAVGYARKGA